MSFIKSLASQSRLLATRARFTPVVYRGVNIRQLSNTTTKAIVAYNSPDGKTLNWKLEDVKIKSELKPHELLVEIKAVGICHTDISFGTVVEEPRVLGHEGSGIVKAVGSEVSSAKVGDPVLLSFNNCDECKPCKTDNTAYCSDFLGVNNVLGAELEKPFIKGDTELVGKFFGQSSFAQLTVVSENSVVNVKEFDLTEDELVHLGPLGCGIQTGAGGVYIAGQAKEGESCAIYGLGGVGFAALMSAKIAGTSPLIAVDINESRLEIAKKLGATHVIKAGNDEEVHKQIIEITNGGTDLAFECIGGARFVQNAINNAGLRGRVVFSGFSPNLEEAINIPIFPFMMSGKQLIGAVEGSANSHTFLPQMIKWFKEGRFPVDQLEKVYPVAEFETALADMKAGKVVKPILKF